MLFAYFAKQSLSFLIATGEYEANHVCTCSLTNSFGITLFLFLCIFVFFFFLFILMIVALQKDLLLVSFFFSLLFNHAFLGFLIEVFIYHVLFEMDLQMVLSQRVFYKYPSLHQLPTPTCISFLHHSFRLQNDIFTLTFLVLYYLLSPFSLSLSLSYFQYLFLYQHFFCFNLRISAYPLFFQIPCIFAFLSFTFLLFLFIFQSFFLSFNLQYSIMNSPS